MFSYYCEFYMRLQIPERKCFHENFLSRSAPYSMKGVMETRVIVRDGEPPASIQEVVLALTSEKLSAKHDKQNWGDWIVFEGKETVISIESNRGLARSAVIETAEGEDDLEAGIIRAFRGLGWDGEDEDGRYPL